MLDLPDVEWIAIDTEASGLFADDGARVACVAIAWAEGTQIKSRAWPFDQGVRDKLPTNQLDLFEQEDPNLGLAEWAQLMFWLRERKLVEHNAKYDTWMLATGTRHWNGVDLVDNVVWDTMLAAGVLEPTKARGLDEVGRRYGLEGKQGLAAIKAWLRKHKFKETRYDLAPWNLVEEYVVGDAEMTAALYMRQFEQMDKSQYDQMVIEMQMMKALLAMERRGVGYDAVSSLEAAEILEKRASGIEAQMPFKCNPTAAKRYFYDEQKLTPLNVSEKTGAPSLDEETARIWARDGVQWATEYAQVMKIRRTVAMHYRGFGERVGPDGRLRMSFKQGHVRTGRMASERVNLLAIPKKDKNLEGVPGVKSLIRPERGNGLWSLDFQQAELRIATQFAQCVRMQGLLASGADLHGITCEEVLRVSRDDPGWREKRDIAKQTNFLAIFQGGGEVLQNTLSKKADIQLPLDECEQILRKWNRAYPEFGDAYRKAKRMVDRKGYVRLLPNTRYEVKAPFGEYDYSHKGWNTMVQGSLAALFKLFLIGVEERWPGHAILCVHDSVLLECLLDEGDEISAAVAQWGGELASELCKCEMKIDVDRWTKVGVGELVPA